jgi:hypothetical protein
MAKTALNVIPAERSMISAPISTSAGVARHQAAFCGNWLPSPAIVMSWEFSRFKLFRRVSQPHSILQCTFICVVQRLKHFVLPLFVLSRAELQPEGFLKLSLLMSESRWQMDTIWGTRIPFLARAQRRSCNRTGLNGVIFRDSKSTEYGRGQEKTQPAYSLRAIGTMRYMSAEQAKLSLEDIDTRSACTR